MAGRGPGRCPMLPPRALPDLRYQIRAQALKVLEELLKWRAAQHAAFHAAVSGTPSEAAGDPPAPPPELERSETLEGPGLHELRSKGRDSEVWSILNCSNGYASRTNGQQLL